MVDVYNKLEQQDREICMRSHTFKEIEWDTQMIDRFQTTQQSR